MTALSSPAAVGPVIPRWMLLTLVGFWVIVGASAVAVGESSLLIPVALLTLIMLAFAFANQLVARRAVARDGSLTNAMSNADDSTPSPLLVPADGTRPLGDTPDAHDEIVPEDLPLSHPGRQAAEKQAREGDGTTRGDV